MKTPYVGFSNATLAKGLPIRRGDAIACPHCRSLHVVHGGLDETGAESDLLLFYKCGDAAFLAAVDGKCVEGLAVDCSGTVDLSEDD